MSLVAPAPTQSRLTRFGRSLREQPAWLGWAAAVVLPGIGIVIALARDDPHELTAGRAYLLVVAVVAFLGGLRPALLATALSFGALAWLFAPPGKKGLTDPDQLGSLALFLVVALVISNLLDRRNAAQREAAEARGRAERLQQVTAALVEANTTQDVLDAVVEQGIAASEARRALVALVTPEGDELAAAAWRNHPETFMQSFDRVALDAALPHAEVARTGRPLFLGSREERDARFPDLRDPPRDDVRARRAPAHRPEPHAWRPGAQLRREPHLRAGGVRAAADDRPPVRAGARAGATARDRGGGETRAEPAEGDPRGRGRGVRGRDPARLAGGRMLSFNRRFVELWELPAEVVASRSDAAALEAIETKLAEPQEFYERVAYLYGHPDERSRDEIELVDGRILERYSSPVHGAEGELFGRVWYFRDITELRRGQEIATVLAAASDLLASTTEIEVVLQLVVRLPIPRLVGICTLYLLDEEGCPRLASVAHWDPEQEEALRELHRRFPIGEEGPILRALRTRETVRLPALDREALRRTAHSEEHLELMEPFASRAAMMVPLVAHGLTYGVLGVGTAPEAGDPDGRRSSSSPRSSRAGSRSRSTTHACTPRPSGEATLPARSSTSPTASSCSTGKAGSATGTRQPPSCSGWTATSSADR